MKLFLITLLWLSLTSCGIAAKIQSPNDMSVSKESYKNCLSQHPNDVSTCESQRLTYQADLQSYRATSSGVRNGNYTEVENK